MRRTKRAVYKRVYKVKYTYADEYGIMDGVVDIGASSKKAAKREFYKLNTPLYKDGKRQSRGYICEAVMTNREYQEALR